MSAKKISIRKILVALGWLLVGTTLVVILIAAINRTNEAGCASIKITIEGGEGTHFVDQADILGVIGAKNTRSFTGKSMKLINLHELENRLRKNVWVSEAEMYFNSDRDLEILVKERIPVIRVYTANGASWFMDRSGIYLPIEAGKPPVKLPVFTGLPEKLLMKRSGDSALIGRIIGIADCLKKDAFLDAQIEQVVYTPEKKIELIPLVGNHRILFGNGAEPDKKFKRLKLFYDKVLSKTGMNYYETIDLGFSNQVVAKKASGISTPVDKNKVPYRLTVAPLQVSNPVSSEYPSLAGSKSPGTTALKQLKTR